MFPEPFDIFFGVICQLYVNARFIKETTIFSSHCFKYFIYYMKADFLEVRSAQIQILLQKDTPIQSFQAQTIPPKALSQIVCITQTCCSGLGPVNVPRSDISVKLRVIEGSLRSSLKMIFKDTNVHIRELVTEKFKN